MARSRKGDSRGYRGGGNAGQGQNPTGEGYYQDREGNVYYRDANGRLYRREQDGNYYPLQDGGSQAYGAPGTTQSMGYARPEDYQRGAVGFQNARESAATKSSKKSGSGLTIVAVVLMIIGVVLIVGALVAWLPHYLDYQKVHNANSDAASAGVTSQTMVVEGVETEVPSVDFDALKQYNSEIVGWIQIPDTVINYAVPQHSDNEFYLDHALDQSYNQYGSIFMDCNSDPTLADYNTVIYGHHLQNGEEFAKIADYSSQSEFDTLTYIYYVTEDGTVHVLSPLCAMVVNGYDVDSIRTSFSDKQDFAQYVSSTLARSSAKTSKTVTSEITHLYMLSTCSYANDNDRTILVCVDASVFGEAASEGTNDAVASIEQGVSSVTGVENSDESTQNAEAGQAQVTA